MGNRYFNNIRELFRLTLLIWLWLSQQVNANEHIADKARVIELNKKKFTLNSMAPSTPIGQAPHHLDTFITQVFNELDIDIHYRNIPSRRTFKETNSGFTDGSYPHIANANLSYQNLIRVPHTLGVHELVMVTSNANINLSLGLAGLGQYTVGYIAGWEMVKPLLKHFSHSYAIATKSKLFEMLQAKRFDIALYGRELSRAHLKQHQLCNLRILEPALRTDNLYLFMHKKHQALVPRLAKKIKQLRNGAHVKL